MPKKTFECAEIAGANLIVQVKKNQKSLLKQITHGAKVGNSLAKQIDDPQKHHGRLEERSYEVYSATEVLKHWPEWEHVEEIIVVSRKRTILSRVSPPKVETEVSYYLSNTKAKASCYAKYIREHWFVENKLHNVKDVAFQEDRLPKRICALNYSCLVDFALNVLRASGIDNIRGTLYTASLDFFEFLKNSNVNL